MRGIVNEWLLNHHRCRKFHKNRTMDKIADVVASQSGVSLDKIRSKSRKMPLPELRQIILYFGMKFRLGTLEKVGSYLKKDHSTVCHSIKQVNNRIDTDPDFRLLVENISCRL